MKELTSYDIEKLAHQLNIDIKGIYCRDEITKINKLGWYVINMDLHTGSGTHWVCCYFGQNHNFYFDSFGEVAPQQLHNKLEPYMYNHKQIQSMNSDSCGWYCLAVIRYCESYGNTTHSFHPCVFE
jgi:hypothetical protein